jgi:hypothetical protein
MSTPQSHTETPWTIDGINVIGSDGQPVCQLFGADERDILEDEANAINDANAEFLIRACNCHEELLEALRRLEFAARARENRAGDPCGYLDAQAELAAAAKSARAAISKATKE